MNILGVLSGITINQHDATAALICGNRIIASVEEERFTRVKRARGRLPINAIRACLREANLSIKDIDILVHPGETFADLPGRITLYMKHYFGHCPPIYLINHHLAHMASAYYCSNFQEAMILSYDGEGDSLSTAMGTGTESGIKVLETRGESQSLGIFYSIMTSFLGFQMNESEYKVMGLAAYGKPGIDLSSFVTVDSDYYINPEFLERDPYHASVFEPYYNDKLIKLVGNPRQPGEPLTQRHRDIAYATQKILEESGKTILRNLHDKTGLDSICMAGGVALNCSANYKIHQLPFINNLFVSPVADDKGIALGGALQVAFENGISIRGLDHVYLGPRYTVEQIKQALDLTSNEYHESEDPTKEAAEMIANGEIVGWWQGRSELGPRALGNRSILADARPAMMKDKINSRVKFREEFRPFAPAVLEDHSSEIFEMKGPSPFMTVAYPVLKDWQARIAAVTHVNGTARVQTVNKTTNPLFYQLIKRFYDLTGVPVVLNTSFNVMGEPIVETPLDAIRTYSASGMDVLFIGPFVLNKKRR